VYCQDGLPTGRPLHQISSGGSIQLFGSLPWGLFDNSKDSQCVINNFSDTLIIFSNGFMDLHGNTQRSTNYCLSRRYKAVKILDRPLSSWDDLGFTSHALHTIGFSAQMGPDIENMTLNEYLEYEVEKERQSWKNVQSKSSPTRKQIRRISFNSSQENAQDQFPIHHDPNITMEEYIRLKEEKARRRVFNDELTSEEALSCEPTIRPLNDNEIDFKISFDESDDEDYTVTFDKNSFSYKIISVDNLKIDSKNDNDKVNMPSFSSPEPMVSYFDDIDYLKDFENEFPAIVYNDALTSKSDFLTEPTESPQHIDEFDFKDETSLSCTLNLLNHPFNIDLMPIELGSFDAIIGMGWLAKYKAIIVCAEKIVRIPWGNETLIIHGDDSNQGNATRLSIISCIKTKKYVKKGFPIFLAHITKKEVEDKSKEKRLEDVPVV
nr:reverse transcriptase domain-containing protein [Tanacetum cinerariifolium]